MAILSRQRGPIAVYGATGYTGKLVAAELARTKADFVVSGRNPGKLEALAGELDGDVRWQAAPVDDDDSLKKLLGDCAAVIDCAGPFTQLGEPVLRAAVETGTHYLDTTGEQNYMRMAFERYGPLAESAGVAVIPAMGFDYVPGDMIASLTAEGMGEVDDVSLNYSAAGFSATRGTMLSTLEILKGDAVEWRKLQWLPAQAGSPGSFEFPEPVGRKRMVRYPAGEQITVPRHIPTRRVQTAISASTLAPGPMGSVLPLLMRPTGLALRTPLKGALGTLINRLPEGPSAEDRTAVRFTIVCDVTRGEQTRRGIVRGSDVYGLTAASVAEGARIAAEGGIPGAGGLAPSQAFEPKRFLGKLGRFDIEWELEGASEPVAAGA